MAALGLAAHQAFSSHLERRQDGNDDLNDDDTYFWWTKEGIIIKYVIFLSLLALITAWVIGGRMHARRRLRRGLKPRGYHAWLLSRQERAMVDPAYAWPQATYGVYRPAYGMNTGGRGEAHGMNDMPPPPVYDPSRPPVYSQQGPPQPEGGSKLDPAQGASSGGHYYAPPPGPPPPATQ